MCQGEFNCSCRDRGWRETVEAMEKKLKKKNAEIRRLKAIVAEYSYLSRKEHS